MGKRIFTTIAILLSAALSASAQQTYSYTVQRTIPINWRPETKETQRYTIAVHPFHLINNGLKFDFEYELGKPGTWLQAGITGYAAPSRDARYLWDDYYGYNHRNTPNSGGNSYERMWGMGVSALYKHMWSRRGWYFSTGLSLEFFRVGRYERGYASFEEDGLTFYESASYIRDKSYVRPTAHFNVGKHFSLSRRTFLDLYIGVSASYSIYRREPYDPNNYYGGYFYDYDGMYGFGYRGLNLFNCGFRFGVLLWDKK